MSDVRLSQEDIDKLVQTLGPGFLAAMQTVATSLAAGVTSRRPAAQTQEQQPSSEDVTAAFSDMSLNRTQKFGYIQQRFQRDNFAVSVERCIDRAKVPHSYTLIRGNQLEIALLHLPQPILKNAAYHPNLATVIEPIKDAHGRIVSEDNGDLAAGYKEILKSFSNRFANTWQFITWSSVEQWLTSQLSTDTCFDLPPPQGLPMVISPPAAPVGGAPGTAGGPATGSNGGTGGGTPGMTSGHGSAAGGAPGAASSLATGSNGGVGGGTAGMTPGQVSTAGRAAPVGRGSDMLRPKEEEELIQIILRQASTSPTGQDDYFHNLVGKLRVQDTLKRELGEGIGVNSERNSRKLVDWALKYGSTRNERTPVIASIIQALFDRAGYEDAAWLASLSVVSRIARSPADVENIAVRYQVPLRPEQPAQPVEFGPAIEPIGAMDPETLQRFLPRTPPDFLDVWLLREAVKRSYSVCRVEVPNGGKGTGVLIDENLVLTNFHVLSADEGATLATLQANAAGAVLRFGLFRAEGKAAEGQTVRLNQQEPVVKFSPVKKQDFVLLRADDGIASLKDVAPTEFTVSVPPQASAINILQHPMGGTMKLALSGDGVTGSDEARGLIQYVTLTQDGSSGSPCFDADWNLVALHHAQRAKMFAGTLREGILMKSIYEQISDKLSVQPR